MVDSVCPKCWRWYGASVQSCPQCGISLAFDDADRPGVEDSHTGAGRSSRITGPAQKPPAKSRRLRGLLFVAVAAVPLAGFGLPQLGPSSASVEGTPSGPHGFPFWVRWSHFSNLFFLFMLIRSGLSILMDHPRLYWNDHCTPGTEWIRFTPLQVPKDRMWTAKDDALLDLPAVEVARLTGRTIRAIYAHRNC